MTSEEFYRSVKKTSEYEGDVNRFRMDFSNIFEEIPMMVQLMRHLKERQIQVVLFSNTNEMATEFIRKRFDFFREFDAYFLSFQHGVMKPDPSIYKKVETSTGKQGEELFFIDDRQENITTALELGWSGIVHEDPVKTRNTVNSWLAA